MDVDASRDDLGPPGTLRTSWRKWREGQTWGCRPGGGDGPPPGCPEKGGFPAAPGRLPEVPWRHGGRPILSAALPTIMGGLIRPMALKRRRNDLKPLERKWHRASRSDEVARLQVDFFIFSSSQWFQPALLSLRIGVTSVPRLRPRNLWTFILMLSWRIFRAQSTGTLDCGQLTLCCSGRTDCEQTPFAFRAVGPRLAIVLGSETFFDVDVTVTNLPDAASSSALALMWTSPSFQPRSFRRCLQTQGRGRSVVLIARAVTNLPDVASSSALALMWTSPSFQPRSFPALPSNSRTWT